MGLISILVESSDEAYVVLRDLIIESTLVEMSSGRKKLSALVNKHRELYRRANKMANDLSRENDEKSFIPKIKELGGGFNPWKDPNKKKQYDALRRIAHTHDEKAQDLESSSRKSQRDRALKDLDNKQQAKLARSRDTAPKFSRLGRSIEDRIKPHRDLTVPAINRFRSSENEAERAAERAGEARLGGFY